MPRLNHTIFNHLEGGFSTLMTSMVILSIITMFTLTLGKITSTEQRISANEYRSQEGLTAAEAGLEKALSYLQANRSQINSWAWTQCGAGATAKPCGDGTSNLYGTQWIYIANVPNLGTPTSGSHTVYFITSCRDDDNDGTCNATLIPKVGPIITTISVGLSADSTAETYLRQKIHFYPVVSAGPASSMMAAGNIANSGNFSVVTNPDGGGTGVPLSVWTEGDVQLSGSATTCQLDEYLASDSADGTQTDDFGHTLTMCSSCTCPASEAMSDSSTENYDILDNETPHTGVNANVSDFPDDIFEYIFGVPVTDWQDIRDEATIYSNCTGLNSSSSGLIWINGDCNIPNNTIASFRSPILLVVQGDTQLNGNIAFFGVIFAFSETAGVSLDVNLTGGPTLYGAIVSNREIDFGGGTYRMRYDKNVVSNILSSPSSNGVGVVAGSWADFP